MLSLSPDAYDMYSLPTLRQQEVTLVATVEDIFVDWPLYPAFARTVTPSVSASSRAHHDALADVALS